MLVIALVVVIVIALIIIFSAIGTYNSLVAQNEEVQTALSQIDNQLQRRSDLIPNLVKRLKGMQLMRKRSLQVLPNHEQSLLEQLLSKIKRKPALS